MIYSMPDTRGEKVAKDRHELGWTQRYLAQRAKVGISSVQALEADKREHMRSARAILDALEEGKREQRALHAQLTADDTLTLDLPNFTRNAMAGRRHLRTRVEIEDGLRRVIVEFEEPDDEGDTES